MSVPLPTLSNPSSYSLDICLRSSQMMSRWQHYSEILVDYQKREVRVFNLSGLSGANQRLLFPNSNKHGPSTAKDQVPSPHYRTCKCWQYFYLAESVQHYGQSSCLPGRGRQQRTGTRSNPLTLPIWCQCPPGST